MEPECKPNRRIKRRKVRRHPRRTRGVALNVLSGRIAGRGAAFIPGHYSYRSARIGSTRLARRAGMYPAPSPTSDKTSNESAKTIGSCPSMP